MTHSTAKRLGMLVCIVLLSVSLFIVLQVSMSAKLNAVENANPSSENQANTDTLKCKYPYDDPIYELLHCVKIDITDEFQKDPSTITSTTAGNVLTITVVITVAQTNEYVSLDLWDNTQNKKLVDLDIQVSCGDPLVDPCGSQIITYTNSVSVTQVHMNLDDEDIAVVEVTFLTKAKKPDGTDTQTYSARLCPYEGQDDICHDIPGWLIAERSILIICCADLTALQEDYQSKIGTPDEWYSKFWLCLNQNACEEYKKTGESGVAGGFNKYMFDYFQAHPSQSALNFKCPYNPLFTPMDIVKLACFMLTGGYHFLSELGPGFFSYGKDIAPQNYDEWDLKHDDFVINKNLPCFGITLKDAFSSPFYPPGTKDFVVSGLEGQTFMNATLLRETVQWYYSPDNLASNREMKSNNKLGYPVPLTREELFSHELANAFPIQVESNGAFFLDVGTSIQLSITITNQLGSDSDLSNLNYILVADEGTATLTNDGVLSIHRTSSPFINARPMLYVFVENNNEWGIGQFAIRDFDGDGDLLADSYESAHGLDPESPNLLDSDLDNDGFLDHGELIMHSDPLRKDTDADGFNDFDEFKSDSDMLDFKCTPNGCSSLLWLPLIVQK